MNKFLARLSFKKKLIGLCLFLSTVSIAIGAMAYNGLKDVRYSYDKVVVDVLPSLSAINNMYLSYRSIRINLRSLGLPDLTEQDAKNYVEMVNQAIADYEKYNQEYLALNIVGEEKALYDDLQTSWLSFKGIGGRALALYATGKPEDKVKLIRIFHEDCPQAAAKYMDAVQKLKKFLDDEAEEFSEDAQESATKANVMILAIAVFGISCGLGVGFIFATTVSKRMSSVASALSKSAEQVNEASNEIAASSQDLSSATAEQAASIEETAASLEEINSMIAKSSENATTTASSSTESQKKAEHGQLVVGRMLVSMEEISQSNDAIMSQVNESNRQMAEIVKVIQEIGNKTKVINEIVFQTKLLSFNASVEAARAGEHGKGFAVVAEEVGNLAQMSGNAAKEISDMLNHSIPKVEAIVVETKTRVESLISAARNKVDSGVDVAKECSEVLNEIVKNVAYVSSLAQEISHASQEQSQGVTEINKAMGQLDMVTQKNSSSSQEAASAAEELSQQSTALFDAVSNLVETIEGASDRPIQQATPNASVSSFVKPKKAAMSQRQGLKLVSGDAFIPSGDDSGFENI